MIVANVELPLRAMAAKRSVTRSFRFQSGWRISMVEQRVLSNRKV